ncbi:hypothetical protein ABB37_04847 [Leptomonas pyrrhocoris]|uniref:Uncharacterized protein n=1 Tax=Leptomonas pyrrhocoris TaxID=157538 RepID=A0A0M9G229_LEPPY|nr:hypothetical protein ABB37_04847 [Leptomonas pyrrhocoris]KPA80663.1 hypothetical protein ABB37_04847 [Leptomonas pyrrhocoris]|eukprot:XP_015659102.1 hypothetical protein ABB37_04847 [Leptomonas pyrrhocoris]
MTGCIALDDGCSGAPRCTAVVFAACVYAAEGWHTEPEPACASCRGESDDECVPSVSVGAASSSGDGATRRGATCAGVHRHPSGACLADPFYDRLSSVPNPRLAVCCGFSLSFFIVPPFPASLVPLRSHRAVRKRCWGDVRAQHLICFSTIYSAVSPTQLLRTVWATAAASRFVDGGTLSAPTSVVRNNSAPLRRGGVLDGTAAKPTAYAAAAAVAGGEDVARIAVVSSGFPPRPHRLADLPSLPATARQPPPRAASAG